MRLRWLFRSPYVLLFSVGRVTRERVKGARRRPLHNPGSRQRKSPLRGVLSLFLQAFGSGTSLHIWTLQVSKLFFSQLSNKRVVAAIYPVSDGISLSRTMMKSARQVPIILFGLIRPCRLSVCPACGLTCFAIC